jgi:hypothetical protein
MRKILTFDSFVNESVMGSSLSFVFIPLDKNLDCLIPDLAKSKTPLPSEDVPNGTSGYLIVPATVETSLVLPSPHFAAEIGGVTGRLEYSRDFSKDGIMGMNGAAFAGNQVGSTGVVTKTAKVPGFSQNLGVYLKSGNGYILEILMKKNGWEEEKISGLIGKKISNGFSDNICMTNTFFSLDDGLINLKQLLAVSSNELGISVKSDSLDIPENFRFIPEVLDLFKSNPGKFMSMNFSDDIFKRVSQMAKDDAENPESLIKTIDNLSDLKSGGFFED